VYTFTPHINPGDGDPECQNGVPVVISIEINPRSRIAVTSDPVLCYDGDALFDISTVNTAVSSGGEWKYNVQIVYPADVDGTHGTAGNTVTLTNLTALGVAAFMDDLTNSGDVVRLVTYTFIPHIRPGDNGPECQNGVPVLINILIEPTPRVQGAFANDIICNNDLINLTFTTPTVPIYGIRFNVTVINTYPEITGYSNRFDLTASSVVNENINNSGDTARMILYVIAPATINSSGIQNCPGINDTIRLWINPTPRVIPINLQPDICYGGTTAIDLTTPTVMTSGSIRFDYDISVSGGPGIVIGNTASEADRLPGYTIAFPYENTSDTIQSVYFSITPEVDNAICVPGNVVVSEIKVHALPLQDIVVMKPLTCEGGAGLAELRAVISKGADQYDVFWTGPVGYYREDSLDIVNLASGKYTVNVTDNLGCFRNDSISIVPKNALAYISAVPIQPGIFNISCIGSTDGTILVSATGGITPPYLYWVVKNDIDTLDSGVFTNNLNLSDPTTFEYYYNIGAGSYTLIIRDVNGCKNINRMVIKVPPPVVVEFGKSVYSGDYNISCPGYNDGSAWIDNISGGRGYYKYRWYTIDGNIPGPVNTNRIDNLIAGKYYLETKDTLNCVKIDSVIISEPDGMQLTDSELSVSNDGNTNISCNGGNDGYIDLTISGGSGVYYYLWSNGATTEDISDLAAGDYSCTVTDLNGCILTPSPAYTLTEPPILAIAGATSISNDGSFEINCNGGTGSIAITVSGGGTGTYQYSWSTTDGSGLVEGEEDQFTLTAGTYHLVVTDFNNCSTTLDITLTEPSSLGTQLSATNITCESPGFNNGFIELSVSGGVAPYTYLWSNGAITRDILGLTGGSYKVEVTDTNGCLIEDSARVELPPPLEYTKTLSDYNDYNISCYGMANGSIEVESLSGLAPFAYSWHGPDGFTSNLKDISDLEAGEYTLLITDSNYCTATEIINLTEPGPLGMAFNLSASTAGGFNINCAGDSTGTIAIEPLNHVKTVEYLWSDGITDSTRINLPAGDYSVIMTDENNCIASSTITLTEPDSLKLMFGITQPFCPDKPDGEIILDITGGVTGYSYRWSDNSTSRNMSDIPRGFYRVIVMDMNGCSIRDSVNIEPMNETCLIIPNAISPNDDLINDVWRIGMIDLYPQLEIKIFNRWGEILWRSEKGYPQPWDGRSNGRDLPIDSYHYIIDLHNGGKPLVGNVTIVR
ncbi:MAG TPA: gliding motility-associated C-terminal domain-containing protein, partial [Bacteroidales bacterium]|nr:gliding motility-associated C-terminal domain-containing protein [Bacteroidales bacterium]